MEVDGREIDIRVSTVATIWGESCVLRVLDKSRSLFRMGDLGHAARHPRGLHPADPGAVRDGAVRRADRKRQDDDPLRRADRDRRPQPQHHDHRGPRRVRLPLDQPDPDERAGRHHLRQRAAVDPAPGPRRHPRRRDPRRRDGPDRRAVGAHRALRAVVAARHRLGGRPAPLPGHGHRVVPGRLLGVGRREPATGAAHLPDVQGALRAQGRGARLLRGERRPAQRRSSSTARAATSAPAPATGTASACSS